ncbi:hypothetical protein CU098_009481 [Rhizopus stolonifer]|uniref:Uncharacterized protein n=1 Tax=Rhizopus stolonifer TaxID=4846 RepID=A0A367JTW0_RHIST|nr:hypothetical protein CU098_009481 [Rhizopus stolonifer]
MPGDQLRTLTVWHSFDDKYEGFADETEHNSEELFTTLVKYSPFLHQICLPKPSMLFYVMLMEELHYGRWKYLTSIPYPKNSNENDCYRRAIMFIRDRVQDVFLCDSVSPRTTETDLKRYRSFLKKFFEFKCLHKLTFTRHSECLLSELVHVLHACPLLKELTLDLNTSESDPSLTGNTTAIQKLTVNASFFTKHVDYFKHHFIDLRHLCLTNRAPNRLSLNTTLELARYLLQLESFQIISKCFRNMGDLARALKNELSRGNLSIDLSVRNQLNALSYTDSTTTYKQHAPFGFHICYKMRNDICMVPWSLALAEFGDIVDELVIQDIRFSDTRPEQNFYDIFSACVRLKSLTVAGNIMFVSSDLDFKIDHLESLTLCGCSCTPAALYELSLGLPSLHRIEFEDLMLFDSDMTDRPFTNTHTYTIDMPCTSFDTFVFSRRQLFFNSSSYIYLKISKQDQEQYYACNGRSILATTSHIYGLSVPDETALTIHIRCKHIKHICLSNANQKINCEIQGK